LVAAGAVLPVPVMSLQDVELGRTDLTVAAAGADDLSAVCFGGAGSRFAAG
jgi:hypothetical protein